MGFDFEASDTADSHFGKTKVSGDGQTGSFRESSRAE